MARDGESIHAIGIDQGAVIEAGLALDASGVESIVADEVATLQHCTFTQMKVCARSKVESACQINSGRHDDDTSTSLGCRIDECLNLMGMESAVGKDAVVGEQILLAEILQLDRLDLMEPFGDLLSVGEVFLS